MTSDRMQKLEELFDQVLRLEPGARHAFIEETCGEDPSLGEELLSLIAAYEKTSGFFEQPPWMSLVAPETSGKESSRILDAEPGLPFEKLGEYRLLKRLGEGGMGIVFLALQESLGRTVALKVIRRERMGSMEAQVRFTREVEAISALRHPNIVAVFGSGEEQGVRYFAMEHVPGDGLDKILADAKERGECIPKSNAIEWIRSMALALETAHRAKILHRDVKPSNIVITPEGRAMLMDFGVARHIDLSDLTASGEFRGTPHYASPEQVKARSKGIDARTDIYSLGVTLYQAVTNTLPFEGETTEQVFRKILDQDPIPPRRLNPSISRDLETVILAAMEKDPNQRYATMRDFTDDLDRVMRGEMTHARPAGFLTRAWKRIRRNPVVSLAVSLCVLTLLALIGYVLWSYPQILEERNIANEQRAAAESARDRAKLETEKARAINDFLMTMLASPEPGVKGKDVRVVDLLDDSSRKVGDSFHDQPEIEAALRETLGMTYVGLGLFEPALAHLQKSFEIRERLFGRDNDSTLASMNGLATAHRRLGHLAEAEALYREALRRSRALHGEEHAVTLVAMHNLALILKDLNRLDEAVALQEKVIKISRKVLGDEAPDTLRAMNNLAIIHLRKGDFEKAEALQRTLVEIKRRVMGDEHPSTLASMANLAVCCKNLKRYAEAESLQREVIEIQRRVLGEEHPDTLDSYYNLANILLQQGEFEEAEKMHSRTLEARRRTLGDAHPATRNSESGLVFVYWNEGKLDEAIALQKRLLDLCRDSLGPDHNDTRLALNNMICLYMDRKNYAAAEPLFEEIIRIWNSDDSPDAAQKVVDYRVYLAECLEGLNRPEEAKAQLLSGYEWCMEHLGDGHDTTLEIREKLARYTASEK